jgi:hypothetical protein
MKARLVVLEPKAFDEFIKEGSTDALKKLEAPAAPAPTPVASAN